VQTFMLSVLIPGKYGKYVHTKADDYNIKYTWVPRCTLFSLA